MIYEPRHSCRAAKAAYTSDSPRLVALLQHAVPARASSVLPHPSVYLPSPNVFDGRGGQEEDEVFVPPELLTEHPVLLESVHVDAPDSGLVFVGKLRLRLYLDTRGTVHHIESIESTMPEFYVAAAMASFRDQKFFPGRINGVPVKTFTEIEVEFNPIDECCF